MKQYIKIIRPGLIALGTFSLSATVQAAGFAIIEGSVSGLGNAFAGGSAVAEDATTIHYNPAGMSRLQSNQLIFGAHLIEPEINFKNDGSNISGVIPINGSNGGDAGSDVVVPNFYYMNNINSQIDFGLGVTAPFGLETNYDPGWVGRYHALKSDLVTININPALSFKVSDKLSIGAGINYSMVDVTLTSNIDQGSVCAANSSLSALCSSSTPQGNDGHADVSGDDASWGYNLGVMYQFTPQQRLGFAYRSEVQHDLTGKADFTDIDSALEGLGYFVDSPATARLNLPAIWSLSYFQSLNTQWDIMADYTLTEWSSMSEIRVDYAQSNKQGSSIEELNWKDVKRLSVGANFRPNKKVIIRLGYAFDESPVTSVTDASARVPDADRTWLTVGLGYTISKAISVDAGYAMIDVDEARIERTNATSATLKGTYDSEINILSAQLNWNF